MRFSFWAATPLYSIRAKSRDPLCRYDDTHEFMGGALPIRHSVPTPDDLDAFRGWIPYT